MTIRSPALLSDHSAIASDRASDRRSWRAPFDGLRTGIELALHESRNAALPSLDFGDELRQLLSKNLLQYRRLGPSWLVDWLRGVHTAASCKPLAHSLGRQICPGSAHLQMWRERLSQDETCSSRDETRSGGVMAQIAIINVTSIFTSAELRICFGSAQEPAAR